MQQAKRVPWKTLAAAADRYTDWEVFTLWLRAVVDMGGDLSDTVARELKSRDSRLVEHIRTKAEQLVGGSTLGADIWEVSTLWAEMNMFIEAKRAGWLGAVRYFSSVSLLSMKAWSYWERIQNRWHTDPPDVLPDYTHWQSEVTAVRRLSGGNDLAQQVLETLHSVPDSEWTRHLARFSDLIAFSLWMELVLDMEGLTSGLIDRELAKRYEGFRLVTSGSKEAVRALHDWTIEHHLVASDRRRLLAALSFHVTNHPAYHALRNYALRCHDVWAKECLGHLPTFEEWRQSADGYVEN